MKNLAEEELKWNKLIVDLVLKMARLLFFPDKVFHRPIPEKGFVFLTGKSPKVLSDRWSNVTSLSQGAADQDETVISHWSRIALRKKAYNKYISNAT